MAGRFCPNNAMTTQQAIIVNSRWRSRQLATEVVVTRPTFREVSYMALDKTFSGTLPLWLFLKDFQPVTEPKKRGR